MTRIRRPLRTMLAIVAATGLFSASARAEDRPAGILAPGPAALPRPPTLTIDSDRANTRLVQFDFLGSGAQRGFYDITPICTAPCTASVLPGMSYRLVAPGMTPSSVLALAPERDMDAHVQGGSWGAHAVGTVLSILGAAYVPLGGGLLAGQEAFGDAKSQSLLPVGGALLAVGVVALAVGLPLWLGSRTHVTLEPARAQGDARVGAIRGAGFTF